MAREGLLKKCPDELYWLILQLCEVAIEIDVHSKILTTLMCSGELGRDGVQKVHGDLIRLYVPDHKDADQAETERLMKQFESVPSVMKMNVDVGKAIEGEFVRGWR